MLFLILFIFSSDSKPQTDFYKALVPETDFLSESAYVEINDDEGNHHFFAHLFLRKGTLSFADIQPGSDLVLWIPGGPGSAGMKYAFKEIGPYFVDSDGALHLREHSWNELAHLLFVDQPFGSGFSYSNRKNPIDNSDLAAQYLVEFLYRIFDLYPSLKQCRFHIFGISYAGHFIPALASRIVKSERLSFLKFAGIGIGGAWTDLFHQSAYSASYLNAFGLISHFRALSINDDISQVQDLVLKGEYREAGVRIDKVVFEGEYMGPIDLYNVYRYVENKKAESYIRFLNENKKVFEVPDEISFAASNSTTYDAFQQDSGMTRANDILMLLDTDLKILIYNGQFDYVVTSSGAQQWINTLQHPTIQAWKKVHKTTFLKKNTDTIGGTIKKYKNFAFAIVYGAGHMTQSDQPQSAYQLLSDYLST